MIREIIWNLIAALCVALSACSDPRVSLPVICVTEATQGRSHFLWSQYFDPVEKKWIRHGTELSFDEAGGIERMTTWRSGILDGPFMSFDRGTLIEEGSYSQGRRVGRWHIRNTHGQMLDVDQGQGLSR